MAEYKLTSEDDVVIRTTDGSRIPSGVWMWGIYQEWLAAGGAPDPAVTLADAQPVQVRIIDMACQTEIFSGFSSSALGAAYHYPAQALDQQNLSASVIAALLALNSPAWAASTTYAAGDIVVSGGVPYVCATAGKSGSSVPTWPTDAGATVKDGTAVWSLWETPFWCESSAEVWAYVPHTAAQITQVGQDGKAAILAAMAKKQALESSINAATTVEAVQAIVWG